MSLPPTRPLKAALATILGGALLAAPLVGFASSASAADAPVTINLIDINDFHGRIDANTVRFAATVEQLRAESGDENTLFMSTGDNVGASVFASASAEDQPTIDVLNALELSASAVGNHEFDKGFADLTDRIVEKDGVPNADWDYLGANVYEKGTETPALPEYALDQIDGLTVAVVGAVTVETPTLVSPAGVADLDFGDPVDAVNRVTGELTDGDEANGEADVVIAAYHEGATEGDADATLDEALADSAVFTKIVNGTDPKVAAIFTGHTHMEYAWDGQVPGAAAGVTRPILQTGSYGANVGHVELTVDPGSGALISYSAENVPQIAPASTGTDEAAQAANAAQNASLAETYPRVAEVKGIVEDALAEAAVIGNQPKGSVEADITTAFSGGSYVDGVYTGGTRDDRGSESTLGNLVANSLVSSMSPAERGGATIGVVNPGGLRSELLEGDDGVITYAEANAVLPFVNNLWTTSLTGAQFKTALEQQWQTDAEGNVPSRAYLQLGLSDNVNYTFDPSAAQGSHITGIWIDGEPIDPAASYRVGSFNFLLQGGDNFREFAAGTDTRDSGLIDRDAWISFLEANPGLAPDFGRHAVQVTDVTEGAVAIGADVSATVSGLNLTSLGSPENTSLEVSWDGSAATFEPVDVTGGSATVTAEVPADARVSSELVLTAQPSGTVVRVPVTVAGGIPDTDRVAGDDRFDSSVKAAQAGWPEGSDTVYVVSGEVFPDALSATPAAAADDAPILLVTSNGIPDSVQAELDRLSPASIIIVGGTTSVNAAVESALAETAPVTRIQGADRYETSRKVAVQAFPDGAPVAVVAAGANFADALSAGAAVGADGPVLLVDGSKQALDEPTKRLLTAIGADEIDVVGGTVSVSDGILASANAIAPAQRLGGADRYDSSRVINAHFFDSAGRVLLATGVTFPDALAGSALAARVDAPLFTVPGTCVPAETLEQIRDLGATEVTLLGGDQTLSPAVGELVGCTTE